MKNKNRNTNILLILLALFSVIFSSNFSEPSFQFSVAIAQNNSKAEADRLRQQGEQQLEAGQYTQGTETLERAMMIYRQIGDTESAKNIVDRLYLIYYSRGANDKLEKLIPIFTELNPNKELIKTELDPQVKKSIDLGLAQIEKQDYAKAKTYFEQALSQAKAMGGEKEQIAALTALGRFYLYNKDYINDRTLAYLEEPTECLSKEAASGDLNIYNGDYANANTLAYLELAECLSAARYQATEKEAASGDFNKMAEHLRETINDRIPILLLIGETYLQQNNPNEALTYLQEASAIATKIDNDYKKFLLSYGFNYYEDPSLYLSRAYYSLGKYDLAVTYAQKAIEKGESFQNPHNAPLYLIRTGDLGNGHGHVLAGIALEKLGKLEQAEQELRQAVQIFETTRKKSTLQTNINENLKLFDNQVRATSLLQRVLLAQNKSAEALAAAEWGRGRLLVEAATAPKELTLEEKIDALIYARYTPESICKEGERLLPEANIPEGLEHMFVSSRVDCDGEALIREIKKSYLEAAQKDPAILDLLTGQTPSNTTPSDIKPPNVEQLKQIAQSHQATLVEYSIISETTFFHSSRQDTSWKIFPGEEQKLLIWVIKPTGEIQSRQIDLKAQNIDIKDLVTNTRQTMGLGRGGIAVVARPDAPTRNYSEIQAKEQLKQLYQLLINPIADLLPTNPEAKVVFVPQKQLFLVPFAALIDSKDKYLIEKHTIITAPSIQSLEVTRQKQQQQTGNSKSALVVGNPTMPSIIQLPNLPGAEREGKEVAQLLNTQVLIGNQATKAQVLKQLPNARYIHLATHGLLDDYAGFGIPGTIALAPSTQDNGLLTSSEIQELNLKAELAVLSACDTGRGDITGDGVVGLSRALIIAGIPSIVVSLWSVPDAPTTELMVEFYRNFQERKLDKAQALRQAMLKIMQTHPNPVNWAAFTLIGEGI